MLGTLLLYRRTKSDGDCVSAVPHLTALLVPDYSDACLSGESLLLFSCDV